MKLHVPVCVSALLLAAAPVASFGQAIVEYGLGVGRAAGVAPGQGVAKSVSGILNSLNKTLAETAEPVASAGASSTGAAVAQPKPAAASNKAESATAPAAKETPKPALPAVTYEDPAGIKTGMEYAELIRRFGEPSMKITSGSDRQTLWYASKASRVELEVAGGKVTTVRASAKPPQSAVVVLR